MRKYILLLALSCGLQTYGQSVANPKKVKGTPSLEQLSLASVDSIFDAKNRKFKFQDLHTLSKRMLKEMNGTILIAIKDSVIVRESSGVIRFYEPKKEYKNWEKEQLDNARRAASNQLTNETLYELASISKQFTAAAVLKLIHEKKIHFTDSLKKFFSKIPYPTVTIHHLLSHTSGLPEYFDFPESWFDISKQINNQELVELLILKKPKTVFSPGRNYKYTNTNYALLCAIVEQVTGMKFEDYLRQNILEPAGLTHTIFTTEIEQNSLRSIARGHLKNKEELPKYYLDKTMGDKGIYSNPEELLKWKIAFFDQKKIIPAYLVDMATSPQNHIKGVGKAKEDYGYGLHLEESAAFGKLIYHGGLWRGFQNNMVYRTSDNLFMVFLSNYRNGAHRGKSAEVLHIVDGV
jgi:CubicO group peptidase (beta-lactamase class C family)